MWLSDLLSAVLFLVELIRSLGDFPDFCGVSGFVGWRIAGVAAPRLGQGSGISWRVVILGVPDSGKALWCLGW